ncbi:MULTISPECIES: hypothetical protein [unclassified Exiguobacterium]|uniref:hypothetical protein n=1 Tax=unclassified Exiguobacterium TaxID=2644629 RepID=UPI002034D713|nr:MULTISPECIES: hypothetical protein [unclassified Exiguobacterium]
MKKAKDIVSKASLALAFGVAAIGTMGVVAPEEAHATAKNDKNDKKEEPKGTATALPSVTIGADGVTTTGEMDREKDMAESWNNFINKYRFWISGIAGIAAVSMILFFIIQFMKLGASAGNPSARQQAISGLVFAGIAAAGLGGVAIIVGFFYTALS